MDDALKDMSDIEAFDLVAPFSDDVKMAEAFIPAAVCPLGVAAQASTGMNQLVTEGMFKTNAALKEAPRGTPAAVVVVSVICDLIQERSPAKVGEALELFK